MGEYSMEHVLNAVGVEKGSFYLYAAHLGGVSCISPALLLVLDWRMLAKSNEEGLMRILEPD